MNSILPRSGLSSVGVACVLVSAAALPFAACKNDGGDSGTTSTTTTTTTTGTGGMGTGGEGMGGLGCEGQGYETPNPQSISVGLVTAEVQLPGGQPAANIASTVCAFNICLYGTPSPAGLVNIDAGGQLMVEPRFTYGDGVSFPKLAAHIPTFPAHDFGVVHTAALPPNAQGAAIAAGQQAMSGGAVLTVPAGGQFEFDQLTYPDAPDWVFRAVEIPVVGTNIPANDMGFELIYGVAPIHTRFCPAAGLTLPNTANWPADSVVEFFINGTTVFEDFAPYGGWAKIAEGAVSSDGTTVSTNAGEGVTELDTVGVRLKQ